MQVNQFPLHAFFRPEGISIVPMPMPMPIPMPKPKPKPKNTVNLLVLVRYG